MATIRRTDIIQKKYFKGRPSKLDRDRLHTRQEAYKWRDARRVYLDSSFDRWRKLRSTLKMKDSNLAWHLMEAHEKDQCTLCQFINSGTVPEGCMTSKNNETEFLSSLIALLKQLCHKYFDFHDSIEVVGILCLEFDKCKKENFSINEVIKSKLKQTDLACESENHHNYSSLSQQTDIFTFQSINDADKNETVLKPLSALSCSTEACDKYGSSNKATITADNDRLDQTEVEAETSKIEDSLVGTDVKVQMNDCNKRDDSSFISDSDPSLEIDIEKMDTSQEELANKDVQQVCNDLPTATSKVQDIKSTQEHFDNECFKKSHTFNSQEICYASKKSVENTELPLDMSMLKANIKQEPLLDVFDQNSTADSSDNNHHELRTDVTFDCLSDQMHSFHRNKIGVNHSSPTGTKISLWNDQTTNKAMKHKDEIHSGIPWQRRDMSRKEEYEYLEFHPFCDLSEFSQHYPHVHQRTYYRWKRRIKEEFIILEQCPNMSYQEFSRIVLQAKESVYCLWKSLISQGKGFFAPSDSSKRIDTKCTTKSLPSTNELTFLQKNMNVSFEDFSRQFPAISLDVFIALKKKVMQEFLVFSKNQPASFKEITKIINISEDVYTIWKDYIASLKSSCLSPDPNNIGAVLSPTLAGAPSSFTAVDYPNSSMQAHMQEDRILNFLNGSSPFGDSGTIGHTNSLNESLSRSYLSSIPNLIFPWYSYYGITPPLGQSVLPMMLWQQMMGLSNSLNLAPNINSTNSSLTSLQLPSVSSSKSPVFDSKSDDIINKSNTLTGIKRSASDEVEDDLHSCDKKIKVSHEKDDLDLCGSGSSRSRKQNKQEYVYYLKNPELGFKELETLFPSISLRTFYRWRKEMNAAVMFIEDKKDMTYSQFQMVFPDIPEDVFTLWKDKSEKNSLSSVKNNSCFNESTHQKDNYSDSLLNAVPSVRERNELTEASGTSVKSNTNEDSAHHRKYNKEEYIFVQKNPDVDFATFSKLYPNISVRSFYRWKKELKDSVEYLKANPHITYDLFRSMDSSVTDEVFSIWKKLAQDEYFFEEQSMETGETYDENDLKPLCLSNRKPNESEYSYLQLNPFTVFSQFAKIFPDVPKCTFYRWKREIQQTILYLKAHPTIDYSHVSVILPEVTNEVFQKWKDLISLDTISDDNCMNDDCQDSHEKVKNNQMTEALLYLMHHPTISFQTFKSKFPCVTPLTFELWLKSIRKFLLLILSDTEVTYSDFYLKDNNITEDIFDVWKKMGHNDIAKIDIECEKVINIEKDRDSNSTLVNQELSLINDETLLNGYEYCQNNPFLTSTDFQAQFPSLSSNLFNKWMLQINEEISFIKCNPAIQFDDFKKLYPHTKEGIFKKWKYQCFNKIDYEDHTNHFSNVDQLNTNNSTTGDKQSVMSDFEKITFKAESQRDKGELGTISPEKEIQEMGTLDTAVESALSKLTKFADSNTNCRDGISSVATAISDSICSKKKSKNLTVVENTLKNNNNISLQEEPQLGHKKPESTSATSIHQLLPQTGSLLEAYAYGSNLNSSANSSLSALMAMSESSDSSNCLNQNFGCVKFEDEGLSPQNEGFSTQRHKKVNREEYIFVKDNPNVDSQEFSRMFPQVSARTFYRWKKEIKAKMQPA